ncbi:hypothetical protein P9869_35785 [Streptomyces ossamyceticus]|nr:hypothetical protein [Streptomyces ossamyceticus]
MAATPARTPQIEVAETAETGIKNNETAEAGGVEVTENETAAAKVSGADGGHEIDLDELLDAVRHDFRDHQEAAKAARGRVRQVARQRRQRRHREFAESLVEIAPRATVHGLITAGFVAFAIALVFFTTGTIAAGLTLCTVAAAAWGLAAVLRR